MSDNFSYEIMGESRVFGTESSGWKLELNEISWNGRPAKFDLRPWSADHQKMGKGLTITRENLVGLKKLLNELDI